MEAEIRASTLGSRGLLANARSQKKQGSHQKERKHGCHQTDGVAGLVATRAVRGQILSFKATGCMGLCFQSPIENKYKRNVTFTITVLHLQFLILETFCSCVHSRISLHLPLPSLENQTQRLLYARQCFTKLVNVLYSHPEIVIFHMCPKPSVTISRVSHASQASWGWLF